MITAKRPKKAISRRKLHHAIAMTIATMVAAFFAILFLTPIFLTITNSFMAPSEIAANYGTIFATTSNGGRQFVAERVNLKFIPEYNQVLRRARIIC